jgi:hypothetical protein
VTDLGDSAHGFRRRLHAAHDARVVPWPSAMTQEVFESPLEVYADPFYPDEGSRNADQ